MGTPASASSRVTVLNLAMAARLVAKASYLSVGPVTTGQGRVQFRTAAATSSHTASTVATATVKSGWSRTTSPRASPLP